MAAGHRGPILLDSRLAASKMPAGPGSTGGSMTQSFAVKSAFLVCCALALVSQSSASRAASAEERQACTPDVFRLCSSEIPNVDRIVACMKRERPKLSPACAKVFNPPPSKTATRSLNDPLIELVTEIIRK